MHKFVCALTGLAAIAGTSALSAQDKTDDAQQKLLEKFDQNSNGYLTFEEEQKAIADGVQIGIGGTPSFGFGGPEAPRPDGDRPPRPQSVRRPPCPTDN